MRRPGVRRPAPASRARHRAPGPARHFAWGKRTALAAFLVLASPTIAGWGAPATPAAATPAEAGAPALAAEPAQRVPSVSRYGGADREQPPGGTDRRLPSAPAAEVGSAGQADASPSPDAAQTPGPGTPATVDPAPAPAPADHPLPGVERPGAHNTGVPAGTQLTVHQGDLIISTPGAVVEGLDVRGFVRVTAPGVTIRNSIIRGRATTSPKGLLTVTSESASVTIEDSELVAAQPSAFVDGVRGWNITARRLNVHGVIDGFHIYGNNVTIESSWIHSHLHFEQDPQQNGSPSHDDSVQIQKGSNIRIVGNSVSGAHNSGIQFTQDQGIVANVTISRNWLDGGGCTINLAEKGRGPFQGIVITDNTFGRSTSVASCAIIAPDTTTLQATGNYFTDGAVARVRTGN